jgi:hypothetical protein
MKAETTSKFQSRRLLILPLITVVLSGLLPGCEKNNPSNPPIQSAVTKYEKATTLEGVVTDNHGPVKSGDIKVTDLMNNVIASSIIKDKGHYSVTVPANTILPIVLTYSNNFQNSATEKFITAVVFKHITQYDINPRTTAIANKARAMGGYTSGNLILAAESAAYVPDANKTTAGFRGDPTKQYGGWH